MTRARTLADMISDGVIGTTELADDVITPVKLDETGSYVVSTMTANGGSGAVTLAANSDIRATTGNWTGEHSGKIQYHNNEWYFQFADKMIGRNGSAVNVFTVDSTGDGYFAGDVGIGDTSPSHKLDVNGNIAVSQGNRFYLTNDSGFSPNITNTGASNAMQFFTGNVERLRIRNDGNIYMNTTTPDLVGNTTSLTIGGSSFGGDGMLSLQSGWGGTTYGRVFASGGTLKIGNPQNAPVSFYSANATRLNIRGDGDLEIFNTQSAGGGNETNALYWKIQNSGNTGQYARLGGISAETVSNWGGDLLFHSKPANATPNDTTEERMRIMYDGRICFLGGAGVANPKIMTYKFSGVGNGDTMNLSNTLRFSGLVMVGSNNNDTAAYVFAVADDSYYGNATTTQIIGESNTAYTYQTLSLSSPVNSNLVLTASGSNTRDYVVMLIGVN